jgi:hypothetical protein
MSENTSSDAVDTTDDAGPQTGVVTFEVPFFLSVDLDKDEAFRSFPTEVRTLAITTLAHAFAKIFNGSDRVDVTSGLATVVEQVGA